MPYITTGGGGMGNQIKKLISALRLDSNSIGHLSYFANVFKNKNIISPNSTLQYIPLNTWRIVVLPTDHEIPPNFCKATTPDKGFNSCDSNGRNVDSEYLRIPIQFRKKIISTIDNHLQFSDEVNREVDIFINKYGKYSAVHLRTFRADYHKGDKSSSCASIRNEDWIRRGRQQCIDHIKKIDDEQIFLASDSTTEVDFIKSQISNKTFIQYIKNNIPTHEETFIDMILLSKGNKMVLNTISTFSEMAWYFGGCSENIYLY